MARDFRSYVFRKTIYLTITILLILTFNFLLFRVMPGDPARAVIPKGASPEIIDALRDKWGLDEPMLNQFVTYLINIFQGDLGNSFTVRVNYPVAGIIGPALANTLVLVGTGTVLAVLAGIVLGRLAAWKRGTATDRIASGFFLIFYCMPTFLFALILLSLFTTYIPNWPSRGAYGEDYRYLDLFGKVGDRAYHTLLPLAALVVEEIAAFAIITRSALIDVMTEEYMVTAVAKGMRSKDVLHRHAMPNAMLPVVTVVAMYVGWVLSGSIMIEVIFSYPGLGKLTWDAVWGEDYPVLQAVFMLETIAVLAANYFADLLLFRLDPRVKI
jgi:peptide/nickel transport system permease protein